MAAHYFIDANGVVRHVKFGEDDYDVTENLIRQLLDAAKRGPELPRMTANTDRTPQSDTTPETYLSVGKQVNYAGLGTLDEGTTQFDYPAMLPADSFALRGRWAVDYQGVTAIDDEASIRLNYHARQVYRAVGGAPALYKIHDGDVNSPGTLTVGLDAGCRPTRSPTADDNPAFDAIRIPFSAETPVHGGTPSSTHTPEADVIERRGPAVRIRCPERYGVCGEG